MSVSLYDLLDVAEDATAAEIRTAWKAAIADLDPTDRRFRAYNDAAGVLLDEEKRAAYDAELAADRDAEPADDAPADDEAADEGPAPEESKFAPPADQQVAAEPAPAEPDPMPASKPDPAPMAVSTGPATWALLVAGFLAALSVALVIVVLTWPGSTGNDSPKEQAEQAVEAEDAGVKAVDAAATAIPFVLSYDYRTLDDDFDEAASYLTDDFAAKRNELFDQKSESGLTLREQVVEDKVVVEAVASETGLTRVSPEGDRATVVVYISQDSQKGKETPRSLQMWATLSMVAEGDKWLLDDICTETDCS